MMILNYYKMIMLYVGTRYHSIYTVHNLAYNLDTMETLRYCRDYVVNFTSLIIAGVIVGID